MFNKTSLFINPLLSLLLLLLDANVFMTIYGTKGKSDKIKLEKKGDSFERGSVDKFTFDERDLGDLTKVVSVSLYLFENKNVDNIYIL